MFKEFSWQLDKETAQNIANTVFNGVKLIANFGTAFLELQTAGSDIEISGSAMFADTNADNKIDVINDGKWSGSMTIKTKEDGTEVKKTTAVKGIWSAYNKENVKNESDDMYCTHPKTIDADGRLCDFPPIDYKSFVSSGMCAEYANCAGN